jgi:hypothetical protein
LIIGEEIRNENVTPRGTPDSTKPKNKGIAEQEQNGVTIPKAEAITLPVKVFFPSSAFRVLSGVKYVLMIPTIKIISAISIITFGNSKTKKLTASVRCAPVFILKTESISQLVTG